MGKVILYIAQSIDGYIARENGDTSWLDAYQEEDYGYEAFIQTVGALVMGSNTYKRVLSLNAPWPYGDISAYVITHERKRSLRDNVTFYSGDLATLVAEIKNTTDRDIWLVGGSQLTTSFFQRRLIEEMKVFVIPILLNAGIPLFRGIRGELPLSLLSSNRYPSGVVDCHYLIHSAAAGRKEATTQRSRGAQPGSK